VVLTRRAFSAATVWSPPGADPAPHPLDSSLPAWYLRKQVELFDLSLTDYEPRALSSVDH